MRLRRGDRSADRLVEAQETDTVLMFRKLHNTARVFRNAVAAEVEEIEADKGNDIEFKGESSCHAIERERPSTRSLGRSITRSLDHPITRSLGQ